MKLFLLSVISAFYAFTASAANVTDTIRVSHYDITIDSIDYTAKTIRGTTLVTVHSKMNGINNITLALTKLTIDSVSSSSTPLTYSYSDPNIRITPPSTLNTGDSVVIKIKYRGVPFTDPSFGGFYFSGNYAFNMGVNITTVPHTSGRSWFPCVDEFTDRATYSFHIYAPTGYKAFCNGVLESITPSSGGNTWNWKLNQTIPTYLASVAVAPFYTIERNYQGIPVELAVLPTDTTATLATFEHLDSALLNDIQSYGPYPFDKVGYVALPFNGGAMEHASSIHIGKVYIDGTINYETLWAHELSHMWWGDLVTCDKPEEMWLNEGFAVYNEYSFLEFMYGKKVYQDGLRTLHKNVLQLAHIRDGAYYPVNNLPSNHTYGYTSYQKGGDVASSIRSFMGDSLFFKGVKSYLNNRSFQSTNSIILRDELEAATGVDLTDYFNTIVFTAGFPHVSIDSILILSNSSAYMVTIMTRERQKGNSQIFTLPVEFTFSDFSNDTTITFTVNALTNTFSATLSFSPQWISVDRNNKLSDAVVDYENTVTDTGSYQFPDTYFGIQVMNKGSENSVVRVENNYVKPDGFKSALPGVRLASIHYFKVDGTFSNGFLAKGIFSYDGRISAAGELDNDLLPGTLREDSLYILYRQGPGYDWEIVNGYTINYGISHADKIGSFTIDTLKRGEYVFGVRDKTILDVAPLASENHFTIAPNPVNDVCRIYFQLKSSKGDINIYDVTGRDVFSREIFAHQHFIEWDTYQIPAGVYFANLTEENGVKQQAKVVVADK